MTVAQHVLAAEQHLQLRVGALLSDRAESVPRILIQETQAGVKRRAAPALEGMKANLVQLVQIGSMSSIGILVAIKDWCASRRTVSVIRFFLAISFLSFS